MAQSIYGSQWVLNWTTKWRRRAWINSLELKEKKFISIFHFLLPFRLNPCDWIGSNAIGAASVKYFRRTSRRIRTEFLHSRNLEFYSFTRVTISCNLYLCVPAQLLPPISATKIQISCLKWCCGRTVWQTRRIKSMYEFISMVPLPVPMPVWCFTSSLHSSAL